MSLFLTPEQLADLTDRHTAPAQIKRLKAMGIPYRYKAGGRVKVAVADALPRGSSERPAPGTGYALEPDFSMFGGQG